MKYIAIKLQTLTFAQPLILASISETLYQCDHIIGNIAFIISTVYAIYKLSKENKK